jgi:hypothetical protein
MPQVPELVTVPPPEGWVAVLVGLRVVGAADGRAGDGLTGATAGAEALGISRSWLREPRSSSARLGEAPGVVANATAAAARVSPVGPRSIAAAAAPISTPATATAEMMGINARDDRRISRSGSGSPCFPNKGQPFLDNRAVRDGNRNRRVPVKFRVRLWGDLRFIFPPIGLIPGLPVS